MIATRSSRPPDRHHLWNLNGCPANSLHRSPFHGRTRRANEILSGAGGSAPGCPRILVTGRDRRQPGSINAKGEGEGSAYRSRANEEWLDKLGKISCIHCRNPKGRPMPEATRRASGRKSKVAPASSTSFAEQKGRMGLLIRTVGHAHAEATVTLPKPHFGSVRAVTGQLLAPE